MTPARLALLDALLLEYRDEYASDHTRFELDDIDSARTLIVCRHHIETQSIEGAFR